LNENKKETKKDLVSEEKIIKNKKIIIG